MKLKLARTMTALTAGIFFVSFLAIFTPPAAAQGTGTSTVDVSMSSPDLGTENRLAPEAELAEVEVTTTISVQGVAPVCVASGNIVYSVSDKAPYSSAVLNPTQQSITINPQGGAQPPPQPYKTKLIISTTREAPAFQDYTYKVKATVTFNAAQQGCNIQPPQAPGEGQTSIKNDYLPLTQVTPANYFQKAGQNKKVTFPVQITNLGNGPSRVKVEVTQPNKNKLDSIIPPAELHLESRATKGPSALFRQDTKVEAQTPHSNGYSNSIYTFNVKFTTAYDGAGQNTAGDETTLVLSVQVQGVYVPGFDPASLIAALGIALAGIGFRRRHA